MVQSAGSAVGRGVVAAGGDTGQPWVTTASCASAEGRLWPGAGHGSCASRREQGQALLALPWPPFLQVFSCPSRIITSVGLLLLLAPCCAMLVFDNAHSQFCITSRGRDWPQMQVWEAGLSLCHCSWRCHPRRRSRAVPWSSARANCSRLWLRHSV